MELQYVNGIVWMLRSVASNGARLYSNHTTQRAALERAHALVERVLSDDPTLQKRHYFFEEEGLHTYADVDVFDKEGKTVLECRVVPVTFPFLNTQDVVQVGKQEGVVYVADVSDSQPVYPIWAMQVVDDELVAVSDVCLSKYDKYVTGTGVVKPFQYAVAVDELGKCFVYNTSDNELKGMVKEVIGYTNWRERASEFIEQINSSI